MVLSVTSRTTQLWGGVDGSGVFLHCDWSSSDCVSSICSTSFIAAARFIHGSETASASALDTSFRAFPKNTGLFSDKFVCAFD